MIWSNNCYNMTWFVNLDVVLLSSVWYKRVTLQVTTGLVKLHFFLFLILLLTLRREVYLSLSI